MSMNILCTLELSPCMALFQCPPMFFSNASKTIGNITFLFSDIKLTICALFQKKSARSATCTLEFVLENTLERREQIKVVNKPRRKYNSSKLE